MYEGKWSQIAPGKVFRLDIKKNFTERVVKKKQQQQQNKKPKWMQNWRKRGV